jgi:hypothetical protein
MCNQFFQLLLNVLIVLLFMRVGRKTAHGESPKSEQQISKKWARL